MTDDLRARLLLSGQCALQERITPSLRAVSVDTDGEVLQWRCVFDETVTDSDKEMLSVAAESSIRDFPAPWTIRKECLVVPEPRESPHLEVLLYLRRGEPLPKSKSPLAANGRKPMLPGEYLVLEDAAPYRSEYYDGAMIAMTDRTYANAVINGNLIGAFYGRLRDSPFIMLGSGMRVLVESIPLYTYPDASISHEPPQVAAHSDTSLINPCCIIEVLAPLGETYGRRATFAQFQKIAAMWDYLAISQDEPQVGHCTRLPDEPPGRWLYTLHEAMDAVVRLPNLQIEVPLSDIYEKVEFPAPGHTVSKLHPLHGQIF